MTSNPSISTVQSMHVWGMLSDALPTVVTVWFGGYIAY